MTIDDARRELFDFMTRVDGVATQFGYHTEEVWTAIYAIPDDYLAAMTGGEDDGGFLVEYIGFRLFFNRRGFGEHRVQ